MTGNGDGRRGGAARRGAGAELRLVVEGLQVLRTPSRGREAVDVVDEISFRVQPGEVLGLVGESGSGKTTMALALLGHVRRGLVIGGGKVLVDGQDILRLLAGRPATPARPPDRLRAAGPVQRAEPDAEDRHPAARGPASYAGDDRRATERLTEMLAEVGLSTVPGILDSYPHQLSGGQQQRVGLAMAFACRPQLIVLDEPTTGLDVTTQRRVLETIRDLCRSYQVAAVYISHDLAVVAEIADHVAVLYAGRIAEVGPAREVFTTPSHPYSRRLLQAVPSLDRSQVLTGLAGQPPRPGSRPSGCFFQPRCEFAVPECEAGQPPMVEVSPTGHARPVPAGRGGRRAGRGPEADPWRRPAARRDRRAARRAGPVGHLRPQDRAERPDLHRAGPPVRGRGRHVRVGEDHAGPVPGRAAPDLGRRRQRSPASR